MLGNLFLILQQHNDYKRFEMKNNRKKITRIVVVCLVVITAILIAGSEYLINFALCPKKNKGRDYDRELAVMKSRYPWIVGWTDSIMQAHALRDTFVIASDGDRHHALILDAPRPTDRTAVIVPGYTDGAIDMLHIGYIYNKLLAMNILIPDLHSNGKSEGKAMQMGWKDRMDVIQWTGIADSLFRGGKSNARIVVHGQSMGAATTMNVSGDIPSGSASGSPASNDGRQNQSLEHLGVSVRCYVEDCGYTSAWDEFSYELGDMFGLPEFPLLYTASALCKLQYGWSFSEAAPIEQVAKCHKPMLFIHGSADTFVPTRMVYRLYAAKPMPKYLMVFPGSKHARSYKDHRKEYEQRIRTFVGKYM